MSEIFTAIITAIISVCTSTAVFIIQSTIRERKQRKDIVAEMERRQDEQMELIKDGVKALLHDKILQKCESCIAAGKATTEEIEEIEYLNAPYRALGGNGTVKAALHKVHELL